MSSAVELAKGAEENGFASMIAGLLAQNVEDHPQKLTELHQLRGRLALVAEDSDVALTIEFRESGAIVHGGIVGIPDVTIRGGSDDLMKLSVLEVVTRFALPDPRAKNVREVAEALFRGRLKIYGLLSHPGFVMKVGRILSVH